MGIAFWVSGVNRIPLLALQLKDRWLMDGLSWLAGLSFASMRLGGQADKQAISRNEMKWDDKG
jgi:hypothetical protein